MASATGTPATLVDIYHCACDRQGIVPKGDGLPGGWERKSVIGPNDIKLAILCPDCVAFEAALSATEGNAISRAPLHEAGANLAPSPVSSSTGEGSVDPNSQWDAPWPTSPATSSRLWRVKLTFAHKERTHEHILYLAAPDPLAVAQMIGQMSRYHGRTMTGLTIIPAPLGLSGVLA